MKQDLLARTYQEAIQENKELKDKLNKIKEYIDSIKKEGKSITAYWYDTDDNEGEMNDFSVGERLDAIIDKEEHK